jgi:hypothetical protein
METYYIDNKEKIKLGLFTNQVIVWTPSDLMRAVSSSSLKEDDHIIVLCELDIDSNDCHINKTSFYGIQLVQDLRRRRVLNKVLFVSFLPRDYYVKNVFNYKIMTFPGHSFLQLPITFVEWQSQFKKIRPINDMALYDMIHHACGVEGIINETIHHIQGKLLINNSATEEIKTECEKLIKAIALLLNKSVGDHTPIDYNKPNFLDDVKNKCNDLVSGNKESKTVEHKVLPKWKKWKVLWLDDDKLENLRPLIHELKERNVDVILKANYVEALDEWEQDKKLTQEICYIISDFRLESEDFSLGKQGYDFLKDIAHQNTGVGLMAYSALTRKFLIESFSKFGVKLATYSKLDFKLSDAAHVNFLADQIIIAGDEHWLYRNNQPQASSESKWWDSIRPIYLKYKNSLEYYTHQVQLGQKINEEITELQKINRDDIKNIWAYKLKNTYSPPTNETPPTNEKTFIKTVKNIIETRRIYIALITWMNDKKIFDGEEQKMHECVRYIIKNSSNNTIDLINGDFEQSKLIEAIKKDKKFAQITTYCLLPSVDQWPIGLLPEEYPWLDINFSNDVLEIYIKTLDELSRKFEQLYTETSIPIPADSDIIFDEKKKPRLNNIVQAKNLIRDIGYYILSEVHKRQIESDYKYAVNFFKEIQKISNSKAIFHQLVHVIYTIQLDNTNSFTYGGQTSNLSTDNKKFYKIYYELYEPWWFYRPSIKNWGASDTIYSAEYTFRKELFIAASNKDKSTSDADINKLRQKRKDEFKYYRHQVDLENICLNIRKIVMNESDIDLHKAIYHGIKLYKDLFNEENEVVKQRYDLPIHLSDENSNENDFSDLKETIEDNIKSSENENQSKDHSVESDFESDDAYEIHEDKNDDVSVTMIKGKLTGGTKERLKKYFAENFEDRNIKVFDYSDKLNISPKDKRNYFVVITSNPSKVNTDSDQNFIRHNSTLGKINFLVIEINKDIVKFE